MPAAAPSTAAPSEIPQPSLAATRTVQDVLLVITPSVVADPAIEAPALLETIRQTLRSRGVQTGTGTSMATVTLSAFETHATSNAVVFGYLPGAGSLKANVSVVDGAGAELSRFDVAASAVLRAPASNTRAFALAPLYRDVADRIANQLAGGAAP